MNLFTSIVVFFICAQLTAQIEQEYGFADKSVPELAQFEYYRGKWKSEMEMKQQDGTFKKLKVDVTIQGEYLEDHKTFQSQFTTNNGFFSTDIRTYNSTTKEWQALFLNAKAQRWHEFTSKLVDGKMTTIVKGGYSGKEVFDVKIVDVVITDEHYLKYIYHSTDQSKTWKLVYKVNVKKII